MTKTKLDVLWNRALREALEAGEEFTRYRFAAMVVSAQRAECAKEADEYERRLKFTAERWEIECKSQVEIEREACAQVCDALVNQENSDDYRNAADWCATRIRARGQQ